MRLNAAASSSNSSPVRIVGPLLDVALADRVGHVAQVRHRLDDHVPHHRPQRKHRQEADHDRRRPQAGPILGQRVDRLLIVDRHADDGHQVAFFKLRIRRRAQSPCDSRRTTPSGVHRLIVLIHAADRRSCSIAHTTCAASSRAAHSRRPTFQAVRQPRHSCINCSLLVVLRQIVLRLVSAAASLSARRQAAHPTRNSRPSASLLSASS